MLYHQGTASYQTAASEAAAHARQKLEALISAGSKRAAQVIEAVQSQQPEDRLIRGHAMQFSADAP